MTLMPAAARLQHGLGHLVVERHQADDVDLLGDQVLEQLDLLRGIDVGRADHRRVDLKSVPPFLMPFSRALNHGMPAILTTTTMDRRPQRRRGQPDGAGPRRAAHQLNCIASIHPVSSQCPRAFAAAAPILAKPRSIFRLCARRVQGGFDARHRGKVRTRAALKLRWSRWAARHPEPSPARVARTRR